MKLYIVCLLVALACVAVTPAPAPQQSANVSASSFGPLTTLYELAVAIPSTVISSAQNAIRGIPIVNMLPVALQTGIEVGKNVAQGMDHTLLGLAGRRGGSNPFAALMNPLGLMGGGGGGLNNGGPVGGQLAAGQINTFNGFSNLVNRLNPLNYLNGIAQQYGQRPGGQNNPFGTIGNALDNLNPLNYLQGVTSQFLAQQNPNGNNPLNTLANGAAQTLNQFNPAALAHYLNGLQQNAQIPNAASNVPNNFIPNGGSPTLTASPGNVPAPASASVSAPMPATVRVQNEEIPNVESSLPA